MVFLYHVRCSVFRNRGEGPGSVLSAFHESDDRDGAVPADFPDLAEWTHTAAGSSSKGQCLYQTGDHDYSSDTSTNVFPSIHVFNTIAMHTAVRHSTTLKKHPWAVRISGIIAVSIVLSTMFIKQHTVIDVVGAMGLNLVTWYVLYRQPQFLTNLREKLVREK